MSHPSFPQPPMPPLKSAPPKDKLKKPRHRHSAVQLAALNSLYEQTEHPTLAQRTELAHSLGLETKSVNAYFQNKRASSKKQPRGSPYDAPGRAPSHPLPWSSAVDDDYYYPPPEVPHQFLRSTPLLDQDPRPRNQLTPSDHPQYMRESAMDGGAPSRRQIDELQHLYRINPYPTLDETSTVAERIGMRHQSIVEWFRTQRSLDRRDAYPSDLLSPVAEASERQSRPYPILPPISTLPLPLPLALPPATVHPSLVGARRLSAVSEDQYYAVPRRSSSPRNATPYGASSSSSTALSLSARQRRGRPDPLQLNSLRRLLSKTPTPSIEERSALAREIGMDLGKVTNWFRNLRQSARKREKKGRGARGGTSEGEDGDEAEYNDSEPVYLSSTSRSSRSETPSDEYSRGRRARALHSSDEEEEAQEAVTPASSPSPPPSPSRGRPPEFNLRHLDTDEKAMARFSGRVPYEDALLLLSFHRRAGMF